MSLSSLSSSSNDTATVVAVGALAATLAAVCHETLGHGLACVGADGHIALLTSIWFRCSRWTPIADAGGPMGNLVAGFVAAALLSRTRLAPAGRLLLVLFGALNLFWFTAQLAFESVTRRHDDWYWALQSWPVIWRPAGAVVGIGGYVLTIRWFSTALRKEGSLQAHAIRLAYVAAAVSAVIAGLLWRPEPYRSALEGFLTLGIAPLGLLSIVRRADRDAGVDLGAGYITRSWLWIAACAVLFGLFLLIQARGLGPMAAS